MKPKILISLLAVGGLLLLVVILRLGSGPGSSDTSRSGSVGADFQAKEAGAPSPADLEGLGERPGDSRTAAESAESSTRMGIGEEAAAAASTGSGTPIRGRVLDADGRPVAGAGIFLGPLGSNRARGIRLRSSSMYGGPDQTTTWGAATAEDAPPRIGASVGGGLFEIALFGDESLLHARGDSHVPALAFDLRGGGSTDQEPILVVAPPAAVAGVVVDGAGLPIEGAEIAVRIPDALKASLGMILDRGEPLEYFARSGTDGRFEIADAPGVPERRLVVTRAGSPPHDQPLAVGPETQLRIVIQVTPEPENALRGIVVEAGGKPVPDATVRLAQQTVRTREDGKFVLDAAGARPGSEILAAKPGFTPARSAFDPGVKTVTLQIGPPTLQLRGRVVDEDGKPMGSVEVRVLGLTRAGGTTLEEISTWDGAGPFTTKETGEEGTFELGGLLPRTYVLGLEDRATLRTMRSEPIQAGRTDLEIRFQAEDPAVPVGGRVVDRNGAPVPGAQIWLVRDIVREEGGSRESAMAYGLADGDGVFLFQVVARDLRVARVSFPGEMMSEYPLEAGQDLGQLELVAYRRAYIQIDVSGSEVQADSFAVVDGSGREVPIVRYEGNSALTKSRWLVQDGRSEPLTVLDSAETAVLYLGDAEVHRMPLRLAPSGLTVVRP